MSDIRIITLLPSALISGIEQPQVAQNPGGQAAGGIAGLPPGTLLSGFIINRDAAGNPILRTESGDVAFASSIFLKIGSEVVIRVQQQAGSTIARLLSVDGQPPELAGKQSALGQKPEVIVGGHLSTPTQASTAGQAQDTLSARGNAPVFLLSSQLVSPALPTRVGDAPALPVGAQLQLRLLDFRASPTNTITPSPTPQAATNAASFPPAPSVLNAYSAAVPAAAAPTVSPAAWPAPGTAAPPQTLPLPAANTTATPAALTTTTTGSYAPFAATVIDDGSDEPLLQTPLGLVRLARDSALPAGSQLLLAIEPADNTAPTSLPAQARQPQPLTALALRWDSLQSVFALLLGSAQFQPAPTTAAATPTAAGLVNAGLFGLLLGASQKTLPSAGSLMAGLQRFAGALRSNELKDWLGKPTIEWLEREGQHELLRQLESEFSQLARQWSSTQPGQWQAWFYPLAVPGEAPMLRWFTKRDSKPKTPGKPQAHTEDTRFVVELSLSQLGELQMDGFVKRGGEHTAFDLIIRSHTAFPEAMQQEILALYNRMGEATGYRGQLLFQAVCEFPVNPMEELVTQQAGSVMA